MKKLFTIIAVMACAIIGLGAFAACSGDTILVVSRESGSGTRDAFDNIIKDEAGNTLSKKADGTSYNGIVSTANIQNSTGNVMTKVSSVKNAIGYISLGSLNDTVKAIKVGGIEATAENVLNSTYKLQRPFVLMTGINATLTAATQDFMAFLKSSNAQKIVKANKFVEQASATEYTAPSGTLEGTIIIKGSTSVDPLMDDLIKGYKEIGGSKVSGIEFAKDATGSSEGVKAAKADTTGTVIGMSSSGVKAADAPSLNYFHVALDAVAVIVNKNNAIQDITIAQLFQIYTGTVVKFGDIK